MIQIWTFLVFLALIYGPQKLTNQLHALLIISCDAISALALTTQLRYALKTRDNIRGMIALLEVFHKEFSKKVKHGRNKNNRAFNLEWISFFPRTLQNQYAS